MVLELIFTGYILVVDVVRVIEAVQIDQIIDFKVIEENDRDVTNWFSKLVGCNLASGKLPCNCGNLP